MGTICRGEKVVAGLRHYGGLAFAIALGLILRFWNLDLKPLWLDETITLLFSLGHRYEDIPREVLLPLTDLLQTLTWQPQSCGAIAQTISQQSTHPPLFFCLMHEWMGYLQGSAHSLRWQVRSLSALFGVGAITAMYGLNCVAFSHKAGVWAAVLMAVSPFTVYLSQEARHYTLPMLLITASLIPFVQLCSINSIKPLKLPQIGVGLAWISFNTLGFYIHYFCVLAFIGQFVTLLWIAVARKQWYWMGLLVIGTSIFALTLLPWLPSVLNHMQKPETDWLRYDWNDALDWLGPILRLLAGVIISGVILPVETQPLAIIILNGLVMLVIAGYIGQHLWKRIPKLWHDPKTHLSTEALCIFLVVLWFEYLLLVYGFHKDLTLAVRYNFVFYPALCALLAASLTEANPGHLRLLPWMMIITGTISSGFVVADLAFQKPFSPQLIAAQILRESAPQIVVVKDYQSSQDIALGLSNALAVQQYSGNAMAPNTPQMIQWAFVKITEQLKTSSSKFTLWRIGALQARQFKAIALESTPRSSHLKAVVKCTATQPIRKEMGVQYQPFRCE